MNYLNKDKKKSIIAKHGGEEKNSGSAEAQIALYTERINNLTEHLKIRRKDFATQQSLIRLVGKRKGLLDYLMGKKIERYRSIIKELNIRK